MDKQKIIEAIAKLSMVVRWKREEIKTNKVFSQNMIINS